MKQEFSCRRLDNKVIKGCMYIPDSGREPFPTVIYCHGYGCNYRDIAHHGQGFAEEGICCVLFDFCGGGPESYSDGNMLEMSVKTERDDLLCVFEALKSYELVDKDRIFIMGESQGGYVAGTAGILLQEKIKGMILWFPAFMIPEAVAAACSNGIPDTMEVLGHRIGKIYGEDAIHEKPYADMPSFRKPVLLIHGDMDELVPVTYSQKAQKTYPNAKLVVISGAGHGFHGDDSDHARTLSVAFIKRNTNSSSGAVGFIRRFVRKILSSSLFTH